MNAHNQKSEAPPQTIFDEGNKGNFVQTAILLAEKKYTEVSVKLKATAEQSFQQHKTYEQTLEGWVLSQALIRLTDGEGL